MSLITWACLRCVQELTTILGPQNHTQGSCVVYLLLGPWEMRFLCCLRIPNTPMNLVNMIDFKPHSIYHIHSYSSRIYLLLRTKNIYCFLLLITIESPPVSTVQPILAAQVFVSVLQKAVWRGGCHLISPHRPLPSYSTRVGVWSLTLPL